MMNNHYSAVIGLVAVVSIYSLYSTAGKMSTQAEERPSKNYFGTVLTSEGAVLRVEYLAVGSRVRTDNIFVYEKPRNVAQSPHDHRIDINLALVDKVIVPEHQKPVRFDNIDYYEIIFQFKGDAHPQRTYLIESNNNLFCDELDGFHNPVAHEFRFSAVKEVTIEGVRSAALTRPSSEVAHVPQREERRHHYCVEVSKTIDALEQEAKTLDGEKKQTFSHLIDKAKNWIGGLCSG